MLVVSPDAWIGYAARRWRAGLLTPFSVRERESAKIEAQYKVALHRLSPVGLVYLWPAKEKRR